MESTFPFFILQLSPILSQEWHRGAQSMNFIHGKVLEWEKRVIWISGFPHVWIYKTALLCRCSVCSFTVPIANYPEEVPALLMLTLPVQLRTALQNPVCFRFSPASPSFLFLDCCWSHSVEEGCLGLYPLLSALGQQILMHVQENPSAGRSRTTAYVGLLGSWKSQLGTGQWKGLFQGKRSQKLGQLMETVCSPCNTSLIGADWKGQFGRGEEGKEKTFVSTHISCEKVQKVPVYCAVIGVMRHSGGVAHRHI